MMPSCKICDRKESRKRTINDTIICAECEKKLIKYNYVLTNDSNRNLNTSTPVSNMNNLSLYEEVSNGEGRIK